MLVGSLGTGLHRVFGCEHGSAACADGCCVTPAESTYGCDSCAFCRQERSEPAATVAKEVVAQAQIDAAGCDGCAVCDLLAQYHSVTPFELDALAIEQTLSEAVVQRHNAVVAAATRLALSRGPPAV